MEPHSHSHSDALDQLQAMVNAILMHVGRAFDEPSNNPRTAVNTNPQLKQVVPATLARYHEALDEFEEELMHAKLTMRRDLALCQANLLSRPKQTEPQQSSPHVKQEPHEQILSNAERHSPLSANSQQHQDAIMADRPQISKATDITGTSGPDGTGEIRAPGLQQLLEQLPPLKSEPAQPGPSHDSKPSTEAQDAVDDPPRRASPMISTPKNDPSAPTSVKDEELDTLFDEQPPEDTATDDRPANVDLKFEDFDFSGRGTNDQFFSGTQADSNAASGAPDLNTINSLLPGLESYANASSNMDDFSGMDMNLPTDAIHPTNLRAPNTGDTSHGGEQMTESNFNDWFDSIDMGEGGAGEGDAGENSVNDVEFDDSWFDLQQK